MKLTKWFPENIDPSRSGVYEVDPKLRVNGGKRYSYFDGIIWYYIVDSVASANAHFENRVRTYGRINKWRGVAK